MRQCENTLQDYLDKRNTGLTVSSSLLSTRPSQRHTVYVLLLPPDYTNRQLTETAIIWPPQIKTHNWNTIYPTQAHVKCCGKRWCSSGNCLVLKDESNVLTSAHYLASLWPLRSSLVYICNLCETRTVPFLIWRPKSLIIVWPAS